MRVLVLTSPAETIDRPDTADTLEQAEQIAASLRALGHAATVVAYNGDLGTVHPDLVFNLVEYVPEGADLLFAVTLELDQRDIAYTGAATEPLRQLGRKPEMKARLRAAGLPTPPDIDAAAAGARFIVKSAIEHASVGLSSLNVVSSATEALQIIAEREAEFGGAWFAETYVDGREFNIAVLDGEVLPIAEILFTDHAGDTPRVVGYAEKWSTGSHAFETTPRVFPAHEEPLFSELERLTRAAWDLFSLTGYARVDFRVDRSGQPYILEVNANPCLAADAGFCAAAAQRGLTQTDVVARLVEAATHKVPARA